MRLDHLPVEFQKAIPVLKQLTTAGFEAYFVGGSVRDAILGADIHDVDIATSAYPEEVKDLFSKTIDVGIQHGTVMVLFEGEHYEITTFRTESTYQDFRRPDHVSFVRSLEEDLKRRDFTINALAMDTEGEIQDLFGGLEDLSAGVIRAVGNASERFHEDALRMMRALRFASQLDFAIFPETLVAIEEHHQLLGKISVERIQVEWLKLMLGKRRAPALRWFVTTECYKYTPKLKKYGQNILTLADLPNIMLANEAAVWLLLLQQLEIPRDEVASFLKSWKCANQVIRSAEKGVEALPLRLKDFWSDCLLYEIGLNVALTCEQLLPFWGKEAAVGQVKACYEGLPIHAMTDLAISGGDLLHICQISPGPWTGVMMKKLEQKVLLGELPNEKAALEAWVKEQKSEAE